MKTYSSTWKTFWQHDLQGPWLWVFILLIPFTLGYFFEDWAFFSDHIVYKILILSNIVAAVKQTMFGRRVFKVMIDEANRTITFDYRNRGSVKQSTMSFRTTRLAFSKKKLLVFGRTQWVAFEDQSGFGFRVTQGRNGFTKEVVRELITDVEYLTHPVGFSR